MNILPKNKKAAAGVGVAALAVAALALGTGTYAAFSDTEAGPGGTLAAGTLTLDLGGTGSADLFTAENIAPGYVSPSKTVRIKNSGSIGGVLTSAVAINGHGGQLQNVLTVGGSCTVPGFGGPIPIPDTVVGTIGSVIGQPVNLPANAEIVCNFTFKLPGTATNEVQGDTVTIGSNFTLNQA